MKKIVFALFFSISIPTFAATAYVHLNPNDVRWFGKPEYVELDGVRHWSPTDAECEAAGWAALEWCGTNDLAILDYSATPPLRDMTPEEIEARKAAADAAQAEAEAQAALQMPDPQTYAPILSNGVKVGVASLVVDDFTRQVIATDDEHSPKHPKDEQLGQYATKAELLLLTTRCKNFAQFQVAWSNYVVAK